MKCPKCNEENSSTAAYCKNCGEPLRLYKTCKNGHNFDAGLENCPYCPSGSQTMGGARTQIDMSSGGGDKTVIDMSPPKLSPTQPGMASAAGDKTMIFGVPVAGSATSETPQAGIRKLVGWLVTYDINPAGIDFKLAVGRHKIGSNPKCDIVIAQPGISEDHALLLYRDEKFLLQDNLSTNGTFVNEVLIEDKVELKNDDVIRIGNIKLKLKVI